MRRFLILLLLLIFITGCAPDPRKEAQAYQIRSEADQNALNQEQAREQAEEMHQIQMQQARLEEQHREATAREWQAGLNTMIRFGFRAGTVALCLMLLAFGISFAWSSVGLAKASAHVAMVKANVIHLDRATRQFPLFIQHVHGTRYALHNPNVGSVLMLDETNPADRQLIATAGATQIAGVIAQEARQSTDPAGVAIVQPPVVDVKDENLRVGRDLVRRDS
jgi:hypothetical protein